MIRTWDIFDTLIARKCIFPHEVFRIIEEKYDLNGFADLRMKAEGIVSQEKQNYNIDDIYDKICEISAFEKSEADIVKEIECYLEIEQAIPITENIKYVKAGDSLISDMYLPKWVIESMLQKVGLRVPVNIIITANGKISGRIWNQLRNQNVMISHVGDNYLSDIKNPKMCGFEANLSTVAVVNDYEKKLLKKDRSFIEYIRKLRLKNPFTDEVRKIYWQLFTINLGALMVFAKEIYTLQKNNNYEYLGFMGRDAYYLKSIFQKYMQQRYEGGHLTNVEIECLYYSRSLVVYSSENMGEYLLNKIKGRKALLIDLRGTGTHFFKLAERIENLNSDLLLCIWLGRGLAKQYYNKENVMFYSYKGGYLSGNIHNYYIYNLETSTSAVGWDDTIELINRAPYNTPIGMNLVSVDEEKIPNVNFSEINDTEYLEVFEKCMEIALENQMTFPENCNALEELAVPLLNVLHAYKHLVFREKHSMRGYADGITFGQIRL